MRLPKGLCKELKETFKEDYPLIRKGLLFAERKHKDAVRDDGSPYFWHPLRVAEYVRKFKQSKNPTILYLSALLHDTLEDTYTSYRELCETFGETIASTVMELSTPKFAPKFIDGKAMYLSRKMQNMTSYALYIKLCDRLDNVCSLNGCTEEKRNCILNDTRIILDNIKANARLSETHNKVILAIEDEMKKYN